MKLHKSHASFGGETRFYSHKSAVTQSEMNLSVFLPQPGVTPKSAIIWLSGLTCSEKNFMEKAGVQSILAGGETMIICPDTSPRGLDLPGEHERYDFGAGAGFYVNATTEGYKDHYQMYDYVNEDIHQLLQTEFGIEVNKISIMGHSMGGHGALILGLKNPEKYQSVSAFAPLVNPMKSTWGQKALTGYLGEDKDAWKAYDACALIASGEKHPVEILVDQGAEDEFYPDELLTENLQTVCMQHNQPIEINLIEDYDHSYYFVASFLEDHIAFHLAQLNSV
jgi:S-formylglutathione hydrolase